jgi:hypothetical protein
MPFFQPVKATSRVKLQNAKETGYKVGREPEKRSLGISLVLHRLDALYIAAE